MMFLSVACFILLHFTMNGEAHNHTKYVYLTNVTGIIRFPLNTSSGFNLGNKETLYKNDNVFIRSLAIDETFNRMFWSDLLHNDIVQSDLQANSQKKIVSYAVGFAEGLSIDWSSDNLYWTDSLLKVIEVSKTSGAHRKVLFSFENGDEPRAILTDPKDGYMFWTDWGKTPKIERSSLAGLDRRTIISTGIKWPNDLSIDYISERLYWIDAFYDHIISSKYDGTDVNIEATLKVGNVVIHPYSFVYYPEYNITYFTDWFNDSLYAISPLANNTSFSEVYKNSPRVKTIGQVRLLGAERPQNVSTPCQSPSNQCSHLCLKSGSNTSICSCPTGMVLNGTACEWLPKDYELFFIDSSVDTVNHLVKYQTHPGFTVKPLSVPSNERMNGLVALDFHTESEYVYWDDAANTKLYRMKSDGSGFKVLRADISASAIEVDQLSNCIYYYDTSMTSLVLTSLDGTHKRTVKENIPLVRDIAIHEEMGYLYYTYDRYIERIDQDGGNLIQYTDRRRRIDVTGLAVDSIEDRLYWSDKNSYKIVSSNVAFGDLKVIVQQTYFIGLRFWIVRNRGFVVQPNSIDIIGDKMYWTDSHRQAIFESEKRFGGDINYITGGLENPHDLHAYRKQAKTEYIKVYKFAVARSFFRRQYAYCARREDLCSYNRIGAVPSCPPGYKQTNITTKCMNCSKTLGANFVCPCNDWASCAQRTYSNVYGCHSTIPYMAFRVRECTKEVRPGFCPYSTSCPSNGHTCIADHDCSGNMKCCKTSCGSRCFEPIFKSDHPCKIGSSGCSHFCLAKKHSYQCACPDNLSVDFFGKTCVTDRCQANQCYNGKCYSLNDGTTLCKCSQRRWVGKTCSLDLEDSLIKASFRNGRKAKIDLDVLKAQLSFEFTDYCVSGTCLFIEEYSSRRRRRMSPMLNFTFKPDDIYVKNFDDHTDEVSITFTVTKPKDTFNLTSGHLTVDTLLKAVNYFGPSIGRALNVDYLSAEKVEKQPTKEKNKLSDGEIAAIIIVVIVLIIVGSVLLYWYYNKRSSSSQASGSSDHPVQYQFENELYDDVNKAPVTLPTMQTDGNENTYVEGATGMQETDENKEAPKDWITFDNAGDEKPPITDFVEAELYSDPYHIDSPPPAYSIANEYENT